MSTSSLSSLTCSDVAVIIPAYNEEGRVRRVLAVLQHVEWLTEIIVVDDGSTDATATEVGQAVEAGSRLHLIRHAVNHGKGAAILTGAQATRCPILLFLDADLIGLKPAHVDALVQPVVQNKAEMTLGLFRGGQLHTDLAHWLTPWLSGQRCLRAGLFQDLCLEAAAGYGIETAITLAARRQEWRVQWIFLPGVSHPISELQTGLWPGTRTRLKMYAQIVKAWRLERQQFPPAVRLPRSRQFALRSFLVLILSLTILFSDQFYNRSLAASHVDLEDIPTLPLDNVQRLLVVAPHPDDEVLGAGGAIQMALERGAQVKVVIMTNGDGQLVAPLLLQQRWVPRPAAYVAAGEQRQAESLAALQSLGVPADSILFLGYPDRGLNKLWESYWGDNCPWRAPYTRASQSPYPLTFNPPATYCGQHVLDDLQAIIGAYRPDLVLVPHPNDDHPDHRAASNFTRLALAAAIADEPAYNPAIWGYLIHFGYYPQPRGSHPAEQLLPPVPLVGEGIEWARLDLAPAQIQAKADALHTYATQQFLLGSFLSSFVRQDEIFVNVASLDISRPDQADTDLPEQELLASPKLPEPAEESTRRLLLGGADLVGLQVSRLDDVLWLTAQTRGRLIPGLNYRILIKFPDGQTERVTWPGRAERLDRRTFRTHLDLAQVGYPSVLGFAVEVAQQTTLDRTGWHFVILQDAP